MIRKPPPEFAELDALPEIPHELAEAALSVFLFGLADAPRLTEDPYATAKAANLDRLLFGQMPILCGGPGGLLTIGRIPRCGAEPCCGRAAAEGGPGCILTAKGKR